MNGDPFFEFERQSPPRIVQSEDATVRLIGFGDSRDARTFIFEFEVELRGDEAKYRFQVADSELVQLDRMYIVDRHKLLLIGEFSSKAYLLMTVELPSGRVLDRFVGGWPEISPNNRLVAFVKFAPLHFVYDTTDQYLVYDLTASPRSNRAIDSANEHTNAKNAGLPVYPEGSRNLPDDNIGIPEAEHHNINSDGFFWLDEHTLAFVDLYKGENNLVIVDLSKGLRQPLLSVRAIDTRDAIDPDDVPEHMIRRPEQAFRVTDLAFADADRREIRIGVKTIDSLRRPESRSFQLRLPEFRTPGPAAGTVR